jgi:hypothetical protein
MGIRSLITKQITIEDNIHNIQKLTKEKKYFIYAGVNSISRYLPLENEDKVIATKVATFLYSFDNKIESLSEFNIKRFHAMAIKILNTNIGLSYARVLASLSSNDC